MFMWMKSLPFVLSKLGSTLIWSKPMSQQTRITRIASIENRASAIKKGLMFLESQFDTKKFPFSCDCFGTERHDLQSASNLPKFTWGNETFNLYLLLLHLGKHLPSTFRNKLIAAVRPNKIETVNFFADTGDRQLFPNDQDTTAVCYHALLATHTVTEVDLVSLSQSIYENVNDDGVLQTYYVSKEHPRYNRLDAVCIINIVRFAYAQRHERFVQRSEDYVFDWLISGKYKSGTTYYPSACTFLYFCSLLASTNYQTRIRFMDTLRREFNQIKQEDLEYPLDYAQTILTGAKIGFYDESLIEKLLKMQNEEDGSWPADALYCTHRVKVYYGSKSISTMLSVLALMETV